MKVMMSFPLSCFSKLQIYNWNAILQQFVTNLIWLHFYLCHDLKKWNKKYFTIILFLKTYQ
jgi:hypothetical protein